jgi:hypothetical protein
MGRGEMHPCRYELIKKKILGAHNINASDNGGNWRWCTWPYRYIIFETSYHACSVLELWFSSPAAAYLSTAAAAWHNPAAAYLSTGRAASNNKESTTHPKSRRAWRRRLRLQVEEEAVTVFASDWVLLTVAPGVMAGPHSARVRKKAGAPSLFSQLWAWVSVANITTGVVLYYLWIVLSSFHALFIPTACPSATHPAPCLTSMLQPGQSIDIYAYVHAGEVEPTHGLILTDLHRTHQQQLFWTARNLSTTAVCPSALHCTVVPLSEPDPLLRTSARTCQSPQLSAMPIGRPTRAVHCRYTSRWWRREETPITH